jgi:hypothetical protein
MYKWTFVSSLPNYRRTWEQAIAARPDIFLPQHGAAIKENAFEAMKAFSI